MRLFGKRPYIVGLGERSGAHGVAGHNKLSREFFDILGKTMREGAVRLAGGGVVAPTVETGGKVVGQGALEVEVLASAGVLKAEDAGVESLARQNGEAVVYKLAVATEGGALEDGIAAVGGVVEERVAYVAHVGSYLVGATGLENTFDEGDVAEAFQHMPMGDGMFSVLGVTDIHRAPVAGRARQIAHYGAVIAIKVAPYQSVIFALDGMVEELLGEEHLRLFILGDQEKS